MITLTIGQDVTGLIFGSIIVAFSWIMQTDRVVNHLFDGFVRSGRNTELERDIVTRSLKRVVPIWSMAIGVFVFGYSLANLLFG